MIDTRDDRLHDAGKHPYWNESAWFGFAIPQLQQHAFVHFFHRPNLGITITNVVFWDSKGPSALDCLYYHHDITPFDRDADMFDFSADSGLTVASRDLLHAYELSFEHRDTRFRLSFESIMDPHDSGLQAGSEEYGKGHYEQFGRIAGEVTLAGATVEIDEWCNRDHSWGPRRVVDNPRGAFHWAVANEQSGFHINAVTSLSEENDPVFGTDEAVISGFLLRDGQVGTVQAGTLRVERQPDTTPTSVEIAATDSLGRDLHALGRATNRFDMYFHGFSLFMYLCSTEWDFDGDTAVGEVQDYFPPWQMRALRRAQATPAT